MAEGATIIEKPRSQSLFPISADAGANVFSKLVGNHRKEESEGILGEAGHLLSIRNPEIHRSLEKMAKLFPNQKGAYLKGGSIMYMLIDEQAKINKATIPVVPEGECEEYIKYRGHSLYETDSINIDTYDEVRRRVDEFLDQEQELATILRPLTKSGKAESEYEVALFAGIADVRSLVKMAEERRSPQPPSPATGTPQV